MKNNTHGIEMTLYHVEAIDTEGETLAYGYTLATSRRDAVDTVVYEAGYHTHHTPEFFGESWTDADGTRYVVGVVEPSDPQPAADVIAIAYWNR